MTTIHPLGLAQAMANHAKVELFDVRSRQEFRRAHIRGARSVPLRTLQPVQLLRERGRKNPTPLFVICDDRASASLAAGMLAAAGCLQPVVVAGGMHLWENQGLPVVHPLRHHFTAMARRCGGLSEPHIFRLESIWLDAVRWMQLALSRRTEENASWGRYEFPAREARRG
jgi:rhodanese-related sulfurtransferase